MDKQHHGRMVGPSPVYRYVTINVHCHLMFIVACIERISMVACVACQSVVVKDATPIVPIVTAKQWLLHSLLFVV